MENFNVSRVSSDMRGKLLIRVKLEVDEKGKTSAEAISTEPILNKEVERVLKNLPKALPALKDDSPVRILFSLPTVIQASEPSLFLTEEEYEELYKIWKEILEKEEITKETHSSFWKIINENGKSPNEINGIESYKVALNEFRNEGAIFYDIEFIKSVLESKERKKKYTTSGYHWFSGRVEEVKFKEMDSLIERWMDDPNITVEDLESQLKKFEETVEKIERNMEVIYKKKFMG